MNTSKFTSLTCCVAVLALSIAAPSFGADSTAKNATPSKTETAGESWQSLVIKAKQHFHITDKEVAERAKQNVKSHFPDATPDEIQKGRVEITHATKLALEKVAPLSGLKEKDTAENVMDLVTAVGFINAVDGVAVATIYSENKDFHNKQERLGVLRRCDTIALRLDALTKDAVALVTKTFGTDKEAVLQFDDAYFKTKNMHEFVVAMQKNAVNMHKARLDMESDIKDLESQIALEKNASPKGKEAGAK